VKRGRRPLLPMLALLAATTAQASQVYRWTDAQGRAHYADRIEGAAAADADRIVLPAGPTVVARLRVEPDAQGAQAWVDNLLAGPIEVMLHADGGALATDPPLPARGTVPALSGGLLARLGQGIPRLRVTAVPGTPNARPRDVEYAWPLQTANVRIQQAWGGAFSHGDEENRHAVDFAVPSGTAVLAARDGVVMQVESGFDRAGLNRKKFAERANLIRILHDDGSMGVYAHLQENGVYVQVGQRVGIGQQIGASGNTGYTSGPHLHFAVQVNRGMRLVSVPFRMLGGARFLPLPR
jgi:murein DD-endopeptidase MepM/ murein hydrolase activator NlpD